MKRIMTGSIAIGDAKREGRQPSHDGEYLSVYYVPGGRDYIVESNAGVAWTSEGEDDALGECAMNEGEAVVRELEEQIAEARAITTVAHGELARTMGAEARSAAIAWGWATEEDFDGDHIIPPYRGWTITYTQAELDLFGEGDTESIDTRASAHRYRELLEEALEAEFPGAKVEVRLAENTTGPLRAVSVAAPEDGIEEEPEVEATVSQIAERVWGDHNWYVDRLYGLTEFAEAAGLDVRKLSVYRGRGQLPRPQQELASGPVWTWHQVQEYIASRRSPEIVVISEVLGQDPDAKPFVVAYHERDGMTAHASHSFGTLEEAKASVPERFVLGKPGLDADADVLFVGRVAKRGNTPSGPRPGDSAYDRDFAQATAVLLGALREGGYEVETPVTGSVIIGGIEVTSDKFDALAMQWARREFEEIDDLVEHIQQMEAKKAERAEADRIEAARDEEEDA
ncbi:MAG: hypothetical protein C4551_06480 [Bacillota bacterium]|jgi:hypothetical protein|nr:MAG: hypothetical protein C4551_06480 [Bacillota bacterium]